MPERSILILDKKDSPWGSFLIEFFEDTPSKLHFFQDPQMAGNTLDHGHVDMAFVNPKLLTLPLGQKLKVARQSSAAFRLFRIEADSQEVKGLPYDESFEVVLPLVQFQKQLVQFLPLPESIDVLVVDDEREIGAMIQDFLENRSAPRFEVEYAENGKMGLARLEKRLPDILVMDIKMPVMDGRELYREIKQRGWKLPVIIFFDAITGDEMPEIHKFGRPSVVEKGGRQSAMPEMMALIKKMAYFG